MRTEAPDRASDRNQPKHSDMSLKTRAYKTLRGYLNAVGNHYESADKFFGGRSLCHNANCTFYAIPSKELRTEVAIAFEKFHWSKSNKARLNALSDGMSADFSFLQCFYVGSYGTDEYYFGNSLCGDAYDYCKRMFTKSVH